MTAVDADAEAPGLVIAIDGPAGAGKSTVGRAVAHRLGLEYLDTGAMYRAVAFVALTEGVPVGATDEVAELAEAMELVVTDDGRVVVNGHDATAAIRGREVTEAVSAVAANTPVREELRRRQRAWAAVRGGGVIEGRDIGTVVFPDAALKLYVTASARTRAERRVGEIGGNVDDVEASINERDRRDMDRHDGPLRAHEHAVVLDTTGLAIDEVVDAVLALLPADEVRRHTPHDSEHDIEHDEGAR